LGRCAAQLWLGCRVQITVNRWYNGWSQFDIKSIKVWNPSSHSHYAQFPHFVETLSLLSGLLFPISPTWRISHLQWTLSDPRQFNSALTRLDSRRHWSRPFPASCPVLGGLCHLMTWVSVLTCTGIIDCVTEYAWPHGRGVCILSGDGAVVIITLRQLIASPPGTWWARCMTVSRFCPSPDLGMDCPDLGLCRSPDHACRPGNVGLTIRPMRRLEVDTATGFMTPDRICHLVARRGRTVVRWTEYCAAPPCSRGHREEDCPQGV
jgi:hypothetical protein